MIEQGDRMPEKRKKEYLVFSSICAFVMIFLIYCIELLIGGNQKIWFTAITSFTALSICLFIANLSFRGIYVSYKPYVFTWMVFGFYIFFRIVAKILMSLMYDNFRFWGVIFPFFGMFEILPPLLIPLLFVKKKKKCFYTSD